MSTSVTVHWISLKDERPIIDKEYLIAFSDWCELADCGDWCQLADYEQGHFRDTATGIWFQDEQISHWAELEQP